MEREEVSENQLAQQRLHGGKVSSRGEGPAAGASAAPKQIKFSVAFCSGEDPEFPVSELNTHSPNTRGWQSPPFCAFPQEIGLEFQTNGFPVNLSQLQILSHESKIATKIDVWVGRGDTYESCQFKRLGHLSLDDNERSEFAARELKSVYVGKQGRFLKLLIHKCHLNRHNIYNQAGIIAINVLGVEATPGNSSSRSSLSNGSKARQLPNRPVPPLQDIAFDLNFDEQTANLMRDLNSAKEQAVANEDFVLAKELKRAEDQVKHVGVKIAGLEAAKNAAVQREDYDEAAAIKQEVDGLRAQLSSQAGPLLGNFGNAPNSAHFHLQQQQMQMQSQFQYQAQQQHEQHHHQHQQNLQLPPQVLPQHNQEQFRGRQGSPAVPAHSKQLEPQHENPEDGSYNAHDQGSGPVGFVPSEDERPIPALQRSPGGNGGGFSARSGNANLDAANGSFVSNVSNSNNNEEDFDDAAPTTDPAVIEEALGQVANWEELPEAEPLPVGLSNETAPLIGVFSEYLVRCLYSRQVKIRAAALQSVELKVKEFDMSDSKVFQALVQVCRMACVDKIANIYFSGLRLLEAATEGPAIKRPDLHALEHEQLMPQLIERLGNNTGRIRQASHKVLMHFARKQGGGGALGPAFVAPFALRQTRAGKTLLWRQLLGRLQLVLELIREFGAREENGTGLNQVMDYAIANNSLAHPHAEVRETAKALVMQLYSNVGDAVTPYLKDLRPKQMEEYNAGFAEIDAKHGGAPAPIAASVASRGTSKKKAAPPSSARSTGSKQQVTSPPTSPAAPPAAVAASASTAEGDPAEFSSKAEAQSKDLNINISIQQEGAADAEEAVSETEEAFTCQFCGRYDESFTEDALDMHYWKECPMLTSCAQCEQVIEVSLLNEHLLEECENKTNHRQCPRCKEAIASQFFDQHVARGSCMPASDGKHRCPLCHKDVASFRNHILGNKGCPKNPRTRVFTK